MTIYSVPLPAKVADYLAAHPFDADLSMINRRSSDALRRKGYVVGPAGAWLGPQGKDLFVDADRDPKADAPSIDPNVLSDTEDAQRRLRQQVVTALNTLVADEAILKAAPNSGEIRDAALHNNQALQKLINVLINTGTLSG